MSIRPNKTVRTNSNRKIVGAIKKHLPENVTLAGEKYTPARLGKMFQNGIDVGDATDAASKIWHAAVAKERATTEDLSTVAVLLRNHVTALFGEGSSEFSDFGFVPRKVTEPDADTKAAAVLKRAATRKARNTMGKRQKAKVTGANTPAASVDVAPASPLAPGASGDSSSATSSTPAAATQAVTTPVPVKVVTGP